MLPVSPSEHCALGLERGDLQNGKDTLNQKPSHLLHLHMCTCEGPHRALSLSLPEVLLRLGLRGPTAQASLLLMKTSMRPPACFIPLQLPSLCPALPRTAVSFILAFPAWLGELIRQRNHYRFKSHTPPQKQASCFRALSPKNSECFPDRSAAAPRVGRAGGPGSGGEATGREAPVQMAEARRGGALHRVSPRAAFLVPIPSMGLQAYVCGGGKDPDTTMPENCCPEWSFFYEFKT